MNKYIISEETVNAVLGYLGERPYKEVSHLVTKLYQDIKLVEKSEKATEDE